MRNNVHRFTLQEPYEAFEHVLLASDVHYDSPHCDRKLLKKHLDQARNSGALVLIFGDWFDVMGTYNDPRSKASDIRSDYLSKDFSYLDMVVEDSVEFLRPYADNIALISEGNHETMVAKKHDTNPLKRLVSGLQAYNPDIGHGRYSGYVFLRFRYENGQTCSTSILHYHHGFGGNAKRSKGMLDVQLEAMKYPDAHILCRGHDHQKWYDPSTTRQRVTRKGNIYYDNIHYIKTGSYKAGLGAGEGGFEVEKNFMPTRLGGWWLSYHFNKDYGLSHSVREAN
jgi:UDP-2,3-diacylglucosamine pyrophosphatase LpxH